MVDENVAPARSGLNFRHFQGESDYSQIAPVVLSPFLAILDLLVTGLG
jgi:hypothetical protein